MRYYFAATNEAACWIITNGHVNPADGRYRLRTRPIALDSLKNRDESVVMFVDVPAELVRPYRKLNRRGRIRLCVPAPALAGLGKPTLYSHYWQNGSRAKLLEAVRWHDENGGADAAEGYRKLIRCLDVIGWTAPPAHPSRQGK